MATKLTIQAAIFDVDGVFTDGAFYYSETGKILKKFGPHDSDGIRVLRDLGVEVYAITADHRGFKITQKRMDDMKIDVKVVSEAERLPYISNNFDLDCLAFMGDGIYDAAVLRAAHFGIAPSNATNVAKRSANYVTTARGGGGAVAEASFHIAKNFFCERFIELQRARGLNADDF